MRTFLFFTASFLVGAVATSAAVFWYVQSTFYTPVTERTTPVVGTGSPSAVLETPTSTASEAGSHSAPPVPEESTQSPTTTTSAAPIPLAEVPLTPDQKELAASLGIDTDTFVIRPAMINCAEETLGPERFRAITQGAQPGPLETVKLLPCLGAE